MTEKVSVPLEEQETIINHNPDMGDWCEVYTTEYHMIRYLDKMIKAYPDQYQLAGEDKYSVTCRVLYKLVKPRKPVIMTEEQRQLRAERLRRPVKDK